MLCALSGVVWGTVLDTGDVLMVALFLVDGMYSVLFFCYCMCE